MFEKLKGGKPKDKPAVAAAASQAQAGQVSLLVKELLTGEGTSLLPYGEIAERVRSRIPEAQTSARSVASLATGLRAAGIDLPDRRRRESRAH